MINIDLSKTPSLRAFVYLLALFPGLFFLSCIAFGNPQLAKAAIAQVEEVYPFPPYGLSLIALGVGFVAGQAFLLLSWIIEAVLQTLYRVLRAWFLKAFRKAFGQQKLDEWFAKYQGSPSKRTLDIRVLSKLISLARLTPSVSPEAMAARKCLGAATGRLLEKRYGIGLEQAVSFQGDEWEVWFALLGKPVRRLVEGLNVGRTTLACGLAGFLALGLAPRLDDLYFLTLCSVFTFYGLWIAGWFFFKGRDPAWRDATRLRAVLLELQECSYTEATTDKQR